MKVRKHFPKKNSYLEIVKPEYEPQKIQLTKKIRPGYIFLDLITGGIWIIFDFITGDIYKVVPNEISYNLKPIPDYQPLHKFELGESVLFSSGDQINYKGEIMAFYPDKAVIKYKRFAYPLEKITQKVDSIPMQIAVPFEKIAKTK